MSTRYLMLTSSYVYSKVFFRVRERFIKSFANPASQPAPGTLAHYVKYGVPCPAVLSMG